ncbi:Neutral zinc metallopeptidase [Drepanopeziza brunnea f. sp. 'multigermtubi' MB_m1]|uniref:Neutral zinc metallopeptidase n=1 Tax=Marssonina brunnea f. sp. multigermtubi (strain MB_m1) TaxID=1072389 RepID=K1XUK4_MARBU|nr:Neutral zinc metallopeptidase [Drepanopeziza brunnea f. sp. 'multigermtubi' MB_m1]EKD16419.1 Neutral zinc metallopeptidase [Drepanopeziza brunnea f. sp. 'multigermtubi' MB_m1]
MDFTKLRATALKDGDDEEAVTVNTRALIDKVLARYSGEWTTLRELIQNAADAQATTVTIKFETLPSASVPTSNTTNQSEILKHVLLHHTLRRLLVTNNGQAFGVNDWSRLKRIAEGNPDETKIGAFGVGFYSVFADCEEPFVSSGNEAMAFYWKANSLFTKRLQLPPEQSNPNTSFVLDYRNTTTPMPNLLSICQFLATSLTFVALQKLELQVDDWTIIRLEKKAAPSLEVPIARDVETRTKEGLMKVQSMDRESVQMDATFMNVVGWKPAMSTTMSRPGFESSYGTSSSDVPSLRSFFSRLTASTSHAQLKTKAMKEEKALQEVVLEDLTAMTTANVFLRVTTAVVKTSVHEKFAVELERATKKPPPKITKLAILTSSYDETAASSKDNLVAKSVDVFSSVLPGKKPGGRIFIGFPTHQTTGAGMHLSAPSVIPTVERESIDLNARWVRTWNQEMLRVAGIMARIAFANEMADLSTKISRAVKLAGHGTKVTKDEIAQFMPEALHTLKSFTFGESTPSSQVSQLIEEAFWTAYKKPSIEIYSSRGVLPTTKVRLATEDLSGFVDGIPVVPEAVAEGPFVNKLKDFGLITEITFNDVRQELEAKALTKGQLVQFIGWAGKKAITGDMDRSTVHILMGVAVAMTGDADGAGDVIALGTITNYLSVSKIPAELPLPPSTMPFQFTRTSSVNELQALGWEPLEIVPWLRFLIETNSHRPKEQSLTNSPQFSASVLQVLSKAWDGLSPGSKTTVVALLQPLAVIPTKAGMKRPGESFFASVKLFEDLPTVTSCPGVKEKFFAAIGVRKTVDLETIFALIKYLASVQEDIPREDIQRLKNSQICPAEAGPKGLEPTVGSARLYRVSELFEPNDDLRGLRLPIIQWPGPPELAQFACREPARLLGLLQGPEKYLGLLRSFADELPQLKKNKTLFGQMKTAKFLIGWVEISASKDKEKSKKPQNLMDDDLDVEDMEDAPIKHQRMESASRIIIVSASIDYKITTNNAQNDDYAGYRLFRSSLVCAPEEEKLEDFYLALGAQTLRSLIQEDLRLGEPTQDTGTKLRTHVLERAKLFLHETPRENIKHDGRWLEKNLWVQIVSSINLRRSLRGHSLSHNEKRSAAVQHEKRTGWTLFVTAGNYDTYQISQAVCKLLLDRPNQSTYLTFEQFLNLSLHQLRARGYNVERILRAKAAEQRMAEEDRKKQMAIEQQQIKEQEALWQKQNQSQMIAAAAGREENVPNMPGAFGSDSPDNSPIRQADQKSRGGGSSIFSAFTKKLGLDSRNSTSSSGGSEVQEQLQSFLGGGTGNDGSSSQPPPPPYDGTGATEKVSNPAEIQQNLHNAIQSSRPYNSSTLFSPPETQAIKEQATYCDSTPAQNIIFLADASNGMRIFVSKTMSADPGTFLAANVSALNTFSLILQDVCDVYALPRKAMHIFHDESGGTIAFNSGGAIFCNFRFFSQLHEKKIQEGSGGENGEAKGEAGVYWWVVIAHELAHNIVKEHDARHSFYTEMLVANNFSKMMAMAAKYSRVGKLPQATAGIK